MTIKEYSKSRGISYEATRKTISKYHDELKGHITNKGRSRVLDDTAISILDNHRGKGSITPSDQINQEQIYIKQLQMENMELLRKIVELQETSRQVLIDNATIRANLESETRTTEKLQHDIDELKMELQSYKPSIFGFYRKKSIAK